MSTHSSYANAIAGSTSSTIDTQHPYYVHPSDSPGMTLIPDSDLLTDYNYSQWRRSIIIALSSKLKLGFVDGSHVSPPATSPLLPYWNRCNHMVISWLYNSLSPQIRSSVVYMTSAKQIWDELTMRYEQTNLPKLFGLRRELSQLVQGTMSITTYYTKFKTLTDELDCISSKPRCTCAKCVCDVNSRLDVYDQSSHLIQFLMGLGEQFTSVRGQILLMKPVPTLSQCYNMLLQEESQRDPMHLAVVTPNNVAMAVKTTRPSNFGDNRKGAKDSGKRSVDSTLNCDYCQQPGHLRDTCFCLHGYPAWHRLHGKPKPKPTWHLQV